MGILFFMFTAIFWKSSAEPRFGPYRLSVSNMTNCPGTVIEDDAVDFFWNKQPTGEDEFLIKGLLKNSMGPLGGETLWMTKSRKTYVTVFSLQTRKFCDILKTKEARLIFPKAVDSRCFLPKGPYYQHITDVNAANHVILGNTFPYGKFIVKLNLTAGRHALVCKHIFYESNPEKKQKFVN